VNQVVSIDLWRQRVVIESLHYFTLSKGLGLHTSCSELVLKWLAGQGRGQSASIVTPSNISEFLSRTNLTNLILVNCVFHVLNLNNFKCIPEDNKICKKTFALDYLQIRKDYCRTWETARSPPAALQYIHRCIPTNKNKNKTFANKMRR
jgi:hypothetical protein